MLHSHQMSKPTGRRGFLKSVALAAAPLGPAAAQTPPETTTPAPPTLPKPVTLPRSSMRYPRIYTGRQLAMLAFPLGGIAAGSISLGGRGQLRDWEIFNRPDKGRSPEYAFASIWAQAGNRKPVAHVLESRIMPPYEGPDGLGSKNAPGLTRLEARDFHRRIPPRPNRFPGFPPAGQRLAGCLLPLHPARCRRIRPARRHPALSRPQSR